MRTYSLYSITSEVFRRLCCSAYLNSASPAAPRSSLRSRVLLEASTTPVSSDASCHRFPADLSDLVVEAVGTASC